MSYTKLFSTIVTSTVWGEPHSTRIVWITMLATANKEGEVMATIPGLARLANVTVQEAEEAIARFLAPDDYSRTPDDEGRRVEKIEGGWLLLNYQKYRRMASVEEAREKTAERQRRFRERNARNASNVTSNAKGPVGNASVTHSTDNAEAEAEAEAEGKTDKKKKAAPAAVVDDVPMPFNSPSFVAAWADWITYRRERKLTTYKPSSLKAQFATLSQWGEQGAIASIRDSIRNNWQGLFEPKAGQIAKQPTRSAEESARVAKILNYQPGL